jgi:Fe-S oxidoreductase
MKNPHPLPFSTDIKNLPRRAGLLEQIAQVRSTCTDCPRCVAECTFLKKYGTPGKIAGGYDPADSRWLTKAFECSLCDLCTAVCPAGLNPAEMFLEMRREAVEQDAAPFPEHNTMLAYEKRGTSKKFSWYSLPENCHTILFPGCTLTGTRPDTLMALNKYLKNNNPGLGIVLDCCCKPSHDLGRQTFFNDMFSEMRTYLIDHGVNNIITACPNCYKMFTNYGSPLEVTSVYEVMAAYGIPETSPSVEMPTISVHDPCVLRKETFIHDAVRQLAKACGFKTSEMTHSKKTPCAVAKAELCALFRRNYQKTWGNCAKQKPTAIG